jgi:hypothetical protein
MWKSWLVDQPHLLCGRITSLLSVHRQLKYQGVACISARWWLRSVLLKHFQDHRLTLIGGLFVWGDAKTRSGSKSDCCVTSGCSMSGPRGDLASRSFSLVSCQHEQQTVPKCANMGSADTRSRTPLRSGDR